MIVNYTATTAMDIFDECPEPGDEVAFNGKKSIIAKVDIVNNSKLSLKIIRKQNVEKYDDISDVSINWDEFDESFFRNNKKNDEKFINENSLKKT